MGILYFPIQLKELKQLKSILIFNWRNPSHSTPFWFPPLHQPPPFPFPILNFPNIVPILSDCIFANARLQRRRKVIKMFWRDPCQNGGFCMSKIGLKYSKILMWSALVEKWLVCLAEEDDSPALKKMNTLEEICSWFTDPQVETHRGF